MAELKKCSFCGKATLEYIDNPYNDFSFLKCPKCGRIDDEKYVTVDERIKQGYKRYISSEEKQAYYIREHFIENNEDEDF